MYREYGVYIGKCVPEKVFYIIFTDIRMLNDCKASIFADDTALILFSKQQITINYSKNQAIYFTRRERIATTHTVD